MGVRGTTAGMVLFVLLVPGIAETTGARLSMGVPAPGVAPDGSAAPGTLSRRETAEDHLPPVPLHAAPPATPRPPAQVGDAEVLTLPNLAPLPPYDVHVGPSDHPQGPVWSNLQGLGRGMPPSPYALRFTTTIQNRGRHPFELVGTPWVPDPATADVTTTQAYQCVRFTGPLLLGAQRACVRYDSVGRLTWHAQHRHFHIDGFGRYELRREVRGQPDMGPRGLVGASQKLGWCVSDMYNWREDPTPGEPGATVDYYTDPRGHSWYQECTSPVLYTGASWRQGISPGWADTYPAAYAGQEIPLKGIPDGIYWLLTTMNPPRNEFGLRIQETTWTDNTSAGRVQLYGGGKKARLLSPMPMAPYKDWVRNPEDQPGE